MPRVAMEDYNGKYLINVDLTSCIPEESIRYLREAIVLIKGQPRNSVLLLTNVSNTVYDMGIVPVVKDYVISNTPYIKASAVVGIDGVKKAIFSTLRFLTLHEINQFDSVQEAKDWLSQI
jgi:hypothetical protein